MGRHGDGGGNRVKEETAELTKIVMGIAKLTDLN